MTEKRFTLYKGLDTINIMDNTKFGEQIYINKSSKDMKCLVGLLNELAEENQRLKGRVSSWKITASEEISEKQELMKQIVKLKEENEILSDELEQAKAVINKKWDEYLKKKELI